MSNFVVEFFEKLGIPHALVDALVLPLLAALVIWVVRLFFLFAIKKRLRRPQDLRRWRRISVYVELVTAGIIIPADLAHHPRTGRYPRRSTY